MTNHRLAFGVNDTAQRVLRSAEVEALEALRTTRSRMLCKYVRMAVYYADVEGFPYKEIAKSPTIGTVMSRLRRPQATA